MGQRGAPSAHKDAVIQQRFSIAAALPLKTDALSFINTSCLEWHCTSFQVEG
jgi:hypothetical protein